MSDAYFLDPTIEEVCRAMLAHTEANQLMKMGHGLTAPGTTHESRLRWVEMQVNGLVEDVAELQVKVRHLRALRGLP